MTLPETIAEIERLMALKNDHDNFTLKLALVNAAPQLIEAAKRAEELSAMECRAVAFEAAAKAQHERAEKLEKAIRTYLNSDRDKPQYERLLAALEKP